MIRAYFVNGQIYCSGKEGIGRSGNIMNKATRIPRTEGLKIAVRDFVRGRRLKKQRVTCRQVLDFLVHEGHIVIARDESGIYEKKKFSGAYRLVRKWVKNFAGYNQGKRTGNLVPTPQNIMKKHYYLRTLWSSSRGQEKGSVHG